MDHTQLFGRWMRISAILYALGGLTFGLAPGLSHGLPDRLLASLLPFANFQPMPEVTSHSWTALSVSMMATIATCCWLASQAPAARRNYAVPVMVAKGVSSVYALAALALHARYAIYLIVPLTDLPLLLITWLLWRRVPAVPES